MKHGNPESVSSGPSEMQALRAALEEASQIVKRADALVAAARGEAQTEKARAALYFSELSRERARADHWQTEAATEVARARRATEGGLAIALKFDELRKENERLQALLAQPMGTPEQFQSVPVKAIPPATRKLPNIFEATETEIGDVTIEYDPPESFAHDKKTSA